MSTAKAITAALAAKGIQRSAPGAIYCVLMDGPRSVCMTEAMLDTWFTNLTPEQKAEICEQYHDGPTEVDTTMDTFAAELTCRPLPGGIAEWLERMERSQQRQQETCLQLLAVPASALGLISRAIDTATEVQEAAHG